MSITPYLFRRGAVYWWRRRLPATPKTCGRRPPAHVQASLGVREIALARPLAAHLTAWSEDTFAALRTGMLSTDQMNRLLQDQVAGLRSKHAALSAGDLLDGNRAAEARRDRIAAAAFSLVAARGITLAITPDDRERLRAEGLTPAEIDQIQPFLAGLVEAGLLPPPAAKIGRLLSQAGLPETALNASQAEAIYLRANAIALREQADIYENASFVDDAFHLQQAAQRASQNNRAVVGEFPQQPAENATAHSENADRPKVSFSAYAEKLINERVQHKRWKPATVHEARASFNLFGKFIQHDDLLQVAQKTLSDFKDFLGDIAKSYGKSEHDHSLTAEQLRAKGLALPENERGLGADALNKHLGYLSKLFKHVRPQAVDLAPLDTNSLRVLESDDPIDEVLPWTFEQRVTIYSQPPFTGCRDWKHRHEPGDIVYHDGLFWCPLLSDYGGLRREEAAALAVADVKPDLDTGIWYIHVRPNEFHSAIKRSWTARRIPVHPELIRLGFLEYAKIIRALGYRMLFPDLAPATPGKPFGEQLNNGWVKVEASAFPDRKPERRAFRSYRHSFNSGLKDNWVPDEMRAELMGHKNEGETKGRYGDRFNLRNRLAAIEKVPVATGHLDAREICLLPPVAQKKRMRTPRRRRKLAEKKPSGTDNAS